MIEIGTDNWLDFVNPEVNGEIKACSSFGMFKPITTSEIKPFSEQQTVPLIDESDWDDAIRQREKDGATIRQLCEGLQMEVLDQNGTNYCWCNGVMFAAMVTRLRETGREIRYSPASVAAVVKRFQNRGGWGEEALDYAIENGINLQEDWPANAIDRRYYTAENKEKAKRHKIIECYRCRTWQEVASSIIAGIPVAVGYNWWSHLVCGVDIVKGSHDLVIANSWGADWSSNGFGVLKGSKKYPDGESVAVCSMTAL